MKISHAKQVQPITHYPESAINLASKQIHLKHCDLVNSKDSRLILQVSMIFAVFLIFVSPVTQRQNALEMGASDEFSTSLQGCSLAMT